MKRVYLPISQAHQYFLAILENAKLTISNLAKRYGVSSRTVRDWKDGKYSIPFDFTKKIFTDWEIDIPLNSVVKDDRESKSLAGRRGAITRYARYGNPGTSEGRVKGGKNSLNTHRARKTGFRLEKQFIFPGNSENLAEFIGIMLGDGGMTNNQIRITLNKIDDRHYAQYVGGLIHKLFGEYPSIFERDKRGVLEIVVSGQKLVRFLQNKGLVVGNKIRQHIEIPKWIYQRKEWRVMALRGLFDTDGSIYQDRHTLKEVHYKSVCVAYTSYSHNLLTDIYDSLRLLGFSPTKSTINRIMVRKREEVLNFFAILRPSNKKHIDRFKTYLEA